MNLDNIKVKSDFFESGQEDLLSYCNWLKRKNTATLYLFEEYINQDLRSNDKLLEIRNIILDISGEISRLPLNIFIEDDANEGL